MMKKILLMLTVMWMSSLVANAQSGWYVAPEVGMTSVQRVGNGKWQPGLKAGGTVGYQFTNEWFGLKSGLFYTFRNDHIGDFSVNKEFDDGNTAVGLLGGGITNHYLQLPVMTDFSWKIGKNARIHFGAGMYAGIAVANHSVWGFHGVLSRPSLETPSWSLGDKEHSLGDDPYSTFKRFDWGVVASLGVEVENWYFNVGYELSLADEGDDYHIDAGNIEVYRVRSIGANYNTLFLTVGYKFHLGK